MVQPMETTILLQSEIDWTLCDTWLLNLEKLECACRNEKERALGEMWMEGL